VALCYLAIVLARMLALMVAWHARGAWLPLALSIYAAPDLVQDRAASLALYLAVSYRESGWDPRAVGDGGTSWCAFQVAAVSGGGPALLEDTHACVERAHALLSLSLRTCRELPASDRLALYARGRCGSASGQRISRDRMALARRFRSVLDGGVSAP
jgi:hypothetical protein